MPYISVKKLAKDKNKSLNWDEFRALGNPENAPEPEKKKQKSGYTHFLAQSKLRIHLEKKGRGGKSVSIIRGLDMTHNLIKELEKKLKSHCGVGGTSKNGEIIIQGDQRDKIMSFLKDQGAKDIKKSGA